VVLQTGDWSTNQNLLQKGGILRSVTQSLFFREADTEDNIKTQRKNVKEGWK
jgi:hypothetical protein